MSFYLYRWSSYSAYVGLTNPEKWLHTTYILNAIGKRNVHIRYKDYVLEDDNDEIKEFYNTTKLSPILANDVYKEKVLQG